MSSLYEHIPCILNTLIKLKQKGIDVLYGQQIIKVTTRELFLAWRFSQPPGTEACAFAIRTANRSLDENKIKLINVRQQQDAKVLKVTTFRYLPVTYNTGSIS